MINLCIFLWDLFNVLQAMPCNSSFPVFITIMKRKFKQ